MYTRNFQQYIYWLWHSKEFAKKATEARERVFSHTTKEQATLQAGAGVAADTILAQIADEYCIPKEPIYYRGEFYNFMLSWYKPAKARQIISIKKGDSKTIPAKGPTLTIILHENHTRDEFIEIWASVKRHQDENLFPKAKRWGAKHEFDKVFIWYKLRKNGLTWEKVHEKAKQLGKTNKTDDSEIIRKAVKRLAYVIEDL